MAAELPDYTPKEIADLTDVELVSVHKLALAQVERVRIGMEPHRHQGAPLTRIERDAYWFYQLGTLGVSRPLTEFETLIEVGWSVQKRVEQEMGRRMAAMLRQARQVLGLTLQEVARAAGIHSKFVGEIEQGRTGSGGKDLFEKACTEGGLRQSDFSLSLSVWLPLMDPRLCRTIREVSIESAWLEVHDGIALKLARSIRDTHDFPRLAELGKVLIAAGCDDRSILDHCHDPGLHASGCWVVDALVRAGRSG